jgi:hypothetical protein
MYYRYRISTGTGNHFYTFNRAFYFKTKLRYYLLLRTIGTGTGSKFVWYNYRLEKLRKTVSVPGITYPAMLNVLFPDRYLAVKFGTGTGPAIYQVYGRPSILYLT